MLYESFKHTHLILDKPDDSIPTDEWLLLTPENRDFAHFIYEIYDHFDLVIKEKLGWEITGVKVNQGTNNIVIGFTYQNKGYVFRVPKYGIQQLKKIMCIRQKLNGKSYFPDVIYYDDKCLIEHYAEGVLLNESSDPYSFAQLATVISDLHRLPGKKFGPLTYNNVGTANDFKSYYMENIEEAWNKVEHYMKLKSTDLACLKKRWLSVLDECHGDIVICHGDLWGNNIFYASGTHQITLIDWDTCGIYHREKDLRFLISKSITEEQRSAFFAHYPHEVNQRLLYWYHFTMQLKYWRRKDAQSFINAANSFLSMEGTNLHLTNDHAKIK